LINYFKSYSSLGDDRFFVSPWMTHNHKNITYINFKQRTQYRNILQAPIAAVWTN